MNVTYIDHMGTDLTVVNAARVSFDKESDWIYEDTKPVDVDAKSRSLWNIEPVWLNTADQKLISYLAKHDHWTPFSHCTATFRVKAPIFVARQLFKHKVGLTENEISRRYVDSEPEFYMPNVWRGIAENKKQGSAGVVEVDDNWVHQVFLECNELYFGLLDKGVCPEQARMVLPQAMYTSWYWTGSMAAFARICGLRMSDDAQAESREIAEMIDKECSTLWPISWEALRGV